MNELPLSFAPQVPATQQTLFLRKLADQLAKDLYPLFSETIPDEPSPEWIMEHTHAAVHELITTRSSALGNVLYRIDLPEGKIRALMAATAAEERADALALQILEREAKKVWTRMHYSSR
jgi:hypothetical protein